MKDNVKLLYLDYCGGPRHNLKDLQEYLPNLSVLAVTIAKRKRPGLSCDFESYFATPFGFCKVNEFVSNGHVICAVYIKVI